MMDEYCACGCQMTFHDWEHRWVCHRCGRTRPIQTTTNADRIRAMSDEELAELLSGIFDDEDGDRVINGEIMTGNDPDVILEWLEEVVDV